MFVTFQPKAWCDAGIMKQWTNELWQPLQGEDMLLTIDCHRAQKVDDVISLLSKECKTTVVYIPPGCTSLVQPLDVVVNKPFKMYIEKLATQHLQNNLDDYVHGRVNTSQRRILFTSWVG